MSVFNKNQTIAKGQQGWTVCYDDYSQTTAQRFERTYQRGLRDRVEDHIGLIQSEHTSPIPRPSSVSYPSGSRLIVVSRPISCDIFRAKSRFSGLNTVRFSMIVPENITGAAPT